MEASGTIIEIDERNIACEHICCAIGNDPANRARAEGKKRWLSERFAEGLVFRRLDERGKVFIEYMPVERVWKPIRGSRFTVINCLWVSGKFKEHGWAKRLLHECAEDSRAKGMDGIGVVTSSKVRPFLTDRRFFDHAGFECVDSAVPYFELWELKWNRGAQSLAFTEDARTGACTVKNGFFIVYSDQCVFMDEYVGVLETCIRSRNIPCTVHKLRDFGEAQSMGSPFGTLGIYYNGAFLTHELMTGAKFERLLDDLFA